MTQWRVLFALVLLAASGVVSPAIGQYKAEFKKQSRGGAKTKPVYDKWVREVGADLVRSAEKIVGGTK